MQSTPFTSAPLWLETLLLPRVAPPESLIPACSTTCSPISPNAFQCFVHVLCHWLAAPNPLQCVVHVHCPLHQPQSDLRRWLTAPHALQCVIHCTGPNPTSAAGSLLQTLSNALSTSALHPLLWPTLVLSSGPPPRTPAAGVAACFTETFPRFTTAALRILALLCCPAC